MRQVDPQHYACNSYESAERFTSYYYQLAATLKLSPRSVLEVGVGSHVFAALMARSGIRTITVDVDPALDPTVGARVTQLPFADACMDACVAFQVLEHLPFERFRAALTELARVCRIGAVISLPEFGNAALTISLPFARKLRISGRALAFWYPQHRFDGEHYWEINKRGYHHARISHEIRAAGFTIEDSWLNPYNPYHRFFVLRKPHAGIGAGKA